MSLQLSRKEATCNAGDLLDSGSGRLLRRDRLPTQYSGFPGSLVGKEATCSAGDYSHGVKKESDTAEQLSTVLLVIPGGRYCYSPKGTEEQTEVQK